MKVEVEAGENDQVCSKPLESEMWVKSWKNIIQRREEKERKKEKKERKKRKKKRKKKEKK